MRFNQENAVTYHHSKFPPQDVDYSVFMKEVISATDAIARFDQMLKTFITMRYYWLHCEIKKP
jgi:hypothetical protein